MGWVRFEEEMKRILQITDLGPGVPIKLDSMGKTEACIAAEEAFDIHLPYEKMSGFSDYGELKGWLNAHGADQYQ